MRGTRNFNKEYLGDDGIIPAYAGNTKFRHGVQVMDEDHPRVCGEHQVMDDYGTMIMGSSPRMRGTHVLPCGYHAVRRIIPAYAGNTITPVRHTDLIRDHPRVCGEHERMRNLKTANAGSSPRMRGTPGMGSILGGEAGIIPAYAGNTELPACITMVSGDHPRVCGEHTLNALAVLVGAGSSPRMRGTPPLTVGTRPERGIIPAYAGNTKAVKKSRCNARDHPRVCGEHTKRL